MSEQPNPSNLSYPPILGFDYFQSPKGSFWNWVEEGKVIEWHNGNTICYRQDLAHILRGLVEQGLPPLAPVLLLLAACADTWPEASSGVAVLRRLGHNLPEGPKDPHAGVLERQVSQTLQFMDVVRGLPAELRMGLPKAHLFRAVFAAQVPKVTADLALATLDAWESGRLDATMNHFHGLLLTRRTLLQDLDCLVQTRQRFPTTEALALHLRTGLDKIPEPLPEPESVAEEPLAQPLDLFDQLIQDPRTTGLARLAQQLVAALRIPLHARGTSDQPIGGVSDITNRGNFDRLLLSELAHDDLSLMARLVNNEALYLRRETPPRPDVRPRTILLDTTLRMWGVPRVFALAAALAWARNSRQARGGEPAPVVAFALGGQLATPLDLDTFTGVVAALSQLDPAPDAGPALLEQARTQPAGDCLLITDAQLLHKPDFAAALAEASPALRFLLTVEHSGELQLYEYRSGHRALVSTARYDLEEMLFAAAPAPRRPLRKLHNTDSPAFLQCEPAPLYFPVTSLRVSGKNTFYSAHLGVLAITDNQRLLFWTSKDVGAQELVPVIEAGEYCFGVIETTCYLLVSSPNQHLIMYALTVATGQVERVDWSADMEPDPQPPAVVFIDKYFYVKFSAGITVFDCLLRKVAARGNTVMPTGWAPQRNFPHIKRLMNNGYTALQRMAQLGVNGLGELVLAGHELRVIAHASSLSHGFQLMTISTDRELVWRVKATFVDTVARTPNERVLFRRFAWPDGSSAVVDSRGLLHLRSADATVPELTLVLIIGQPTAAWAADGTVCGSAYFTGPNPAQRLSVAEFHQQYLQRFIAHLG